MFYPRQGSSFCNKARLKFQAFALRDTETVAQRRLMRRSKEELSL